jgi:hypothetical protein
MRAGPVDALFYLLCAGGSAVAFGLAVHEARSTDAVVADVRSKARTGLSTVVVVDVRNNTAVPRCAGVRAVASDRGGHDLATSVTTPVQLAARGRSRITATLKLTARDYDERLTLIRAVVRPCP